MRLQTFHRSSLLTFQTRVQEAVCSERARRKRHSEERARIGTRGGARVAFGTVSTTVMRSLSFNGVARRTSPVKVLSGPQPRLLIVGCRLVLSRRTRSCSRVCCFASANCDLDSRTRKLLARATVKTALKNRRRSSRSVSSSLTKAAARLSAVVAEV